MPLNILDLPSELLDRIIERVLTYQDSPLSNSDQSNASRTRIAWPRETWTCSIPSTYGPNNVKHYESQETLYQNWKSAALTLLLVNQKIAELTRWRLNQFSKSSHYVLDAVLVNETELWPTWIFLTPPCQHVNSLKATIRITGTSPTLDGRYFRFSPHGNGAPPIVCCFFYLLERFFECGPLAEHQKFNPGANETHPFTVNELTLDFKTPSGLVAPASIDYDDWLEGGNNGDPRTSYTWPHNTIETLMIRPEWLANMLRDYIQYALEMDIYMADFGNILLSCVGTISICLDGSLVKKYPVARYLKQYVDKERPKFTKFPAKLFAASVQKRYERRRKAGLPVIE